MQARLSTWMSVIGEDDGGDHPGSDGRQDILSVRLAPFVAVRRAAQVVLMIVDGRCAGPVALAHTLAPVPMMAGALIVPPALWRTMVMIVVLRIRRARSACDQRCR